MGGVCSRVPAKPSKEEIAASYFRRDLSDMVNMDERYVLFWAGLNEGPRIFKCQADAIPHSPLALVNEFNGEPVEEYPKFEYSDGEMREIMPALPKESVL